LISFVPEGLITFGASSRALVALQHKRVDGARNRDWCIAAMPQVHWSEAASGSYQQGHAVVGLRRRLRQTVTAPFDSVMLKLGPDRD